MNDQEKSTIALFMGTLGMSESLAKALVADGLTCIEEIAYVPLDELLQVRAADREDILAARRRARSFLLPD